MAASSHESSRHRPLRVVHVMSELRPGGVEVRTLQLLNYLRYEDIEHEIVTISGRAGELASSYRQVGISVVPMRMRALGFLYRFVRYLRSTRPDVVHAHIDHSNGLIVTLARLAGIPVRISHYRSDTPPVYSAKARFKRKLMKSLLNRHASVIAGVSPTVLTHAWSVDWPRDPRCVVLLNGLEPTPYQEAIPAELDRELGLSRSTHIILHVGRGVPTKNRKRAISILGALKKCYGSQYSLIFVGRDGADPDEAMTNRMELKSHASALGVEELVAFAGERQDIAEVLRGGDVLLVTSTLEGLPGVILEAAASGLPIIASDLPGVRFIAENNVDVSMLSLDSNDTVWAAEVHTRAQGRGVNFGASSVGFDESIFEMRRVAHSYLDVWKGSKS